MQKSLQDLNLFGFGNIYKRRVSIGLMLVLFVLFFIKNGSATALNNQYDPAPFHTIYGTDKFYTERDSSAISFNLSPYYQHTASASKSGDGHKTSAGNIYGAWNMLGVFFNMPNGSVQNPAYVTAKNAITQLQFNPADKKTNTNLAKEENFDVNGQDSVAIKSALYELVGVEYEKMGLRGQFAFDFAFGLGVAVKGGVADYKNIPKSFYVKDATGTNEIEDTRAAPVTDVMGAIENILMTANKRDGIAQALGLDLSAQRKVDLEDLHVSVYWHAPIKFKDNGSTAFKLIPMVSVGGWLPISEERNQDKLFSVPTGNDGFTAVTIDGSLMLDFPEMIQVGAGGGVSISMTEELENQRIPTSKYQVGLIPWKTNISNKPGTVWYANISFKADNFSPQFSFYFDYIFTEHLKDKITIKETNANKKALFKPAVLEERSSWKAQNINAGLKYEFTKNCFMGIAVQGYINGEKTYRTTTMLGSLGLVF
ncbi:MAG: hypothetical protein ABH827_01880 [bacterium]